MKNFYFLGPALKLKRNGGTEMICLGRVTLLDNDLNNILALEYLIGDNRNIYY